MLGSNRSSSTTEASSWNWWQLNNKKSSENSTKANPVGHRDIIKLSSRNEANIARRATETAIVDTTPVKNAEVPIVDVTPIEEVQVYVADTVQDAVAELAGASAAITDGSIVSVATTAAPKTIKKEASLKILANPKHRFLYEDNTPNFRVTLQVIEVEFDPDHTELDAAAVHVKPTEIASTVGSSAAASAAGTGETSIVGAEAVAIAPVTAISATSVAEGTSYEVVTSGNQNLASGGYVSQSNTDIAEVSQTVGGTGAAGGTRIVGGTEVADGTVVAGGTGVTEDEESADKPKDEPEKGKRGGAGAESDSSEEDN